MPHINKKVSNYDKTIIYVRTVRKICRGAIRSAFFKRKKLPMFIGKHVDITHKEKIYCEKNIKFEDYSEIHGLSTNGLKFGKNVTIGRYTSIRPSSYYGVGKIGYGLEMGENSSIGPYGFVGCSGKIKIGKNVMIGPRVSLFAENHNFSDVSTTIKEQGVNNKGITIEDDCWIGSGVIILDGVTIGHGSVIGAGTLVTKDIKAESVVYDKREKVSKNR
ncbi:galactoside O-acetyltransferase [Limosilactobacillus reuteri]|uniref:Galactoside O-acetyltransferase n=2 Tax=Limosilactobacillus reuteri TaxID=1598 RepID=A0AB73QWJ0_LIMRT|nr:acyltransferase [Limosilactobacillus reuteri]OYS85546.1 galactoside O-acetyltransferase [Limosilactobacillus reuteri]OYS92958.1 galactoside O-acetyltransferase [Limosilactobacillus reuteri]OYS94544.1 galactoside O-acetyltransferase [Limosilactobacillus reuteri]OYS95938.1 galactoside O-acetyltransferase [Limosilactobacillus reuteri]OYS99365.1 galactoside O-acetyltransferase [Limosilactobacillus reuteri]